MTQITSRGSKEGTVRIRSGSRTLTLERVSTTAPEVLERIAFNQSMTREYRRAHREVFIPLRKLGSPHIWVIPEGQSVPWDSGDRITVIYRDRRMRFRERVRCN